MLLQYSVSNFKSIGPEVLFSALAAEEAELERPLIRIEKDVFLDKAILYGPNGSGKSSLFESLDTVKRLVGTSYTNTPGTEIRIPYNKVLGPDIPFEVSIQFEKDGECYAYGFSIIDDLVDQEYLYYFPNGRLAKIFERKGDQVTFGPEFKSPLLKAKESLKPNMLFLSAAANLSAAGEIQTAYSFLSEDIILYKPADNWLRHSIAKMKQNPVFLKQVIEYIQSLDIPIRDLTIDTGKNRSYTASELNEAEEDQVSVSVHYDHCTLDLLSEESSGIIELLSFLVPYFEAISKGRVLLVDGIDAILHEKIVYSILSSFTDLAHASKAQLFCIAQDTSFLDLDLFQRDQIWFMQSMPDTGFTELYSLIEIRNVRRDENVAENYRNGKYGAVPKLKRPVR